MSHDKLQTNFKVSELFQVARFFFFVSKFFEFTLNMNRGNRTELNTGPDGSGREVECWEGAGQDARKYFTLLR